MFQKPEALESPALLEEHKEKERRKKDAVSAALKDYDAAVINAKEKQEAWNNAYEKVCLEMQNEEENRYDAIIKVTRKMAEG